MSSHNICFCGDIKNIFLIPSFRSYALYSLILPFQSGFRILGLAVDFGSRFLFWSDISPEFKGIYRANLDGKNVTTIVKGKRTKIEIYQIGYRELIIWRRYIIYS